MSDKNVALSITIKAIDEATARFKAINAEIMKPEHPVGRLQKALSGLGGEASESGGLGALLGGFTAVGSAVAAAVEKVAAFGGIVVGAAGAAAAGVVHLANEFADLGEKSKRLGVSADFLAEMRYAAEKTGVPVDKLDESLQTFNENLGQARAGTGRMAKFLEMVNPAFLEQLKTAKDNATAFDDLASAMSRLKDPAKRAALAQKTLGDSALAPMFAQGAQGIAQLRERYMQMAGSQEDATKAGEQMHSSLTDLHAATDGVKAALVVGLGPAIKDIVDKITEWVSGHRADIARWAAKIGAAIPGVVAKITDAFGHAYDWVTGHWGQITDFFTTLWNGVSVAFQVAWPIIKATVDQITGAVDTVRATVAFLQHPFAREGDALKIAQESEVDNKGWIRASLDERRADQMGWIQSSLTDAAPSIQAARQAAAAAQAAHINARIATVRDALGADERPTFQREDLAVTHPMLFAPARHDSRDDDIERMAAALANAVNTSKGGKITVDFANAPRGTRVRTDSTAADAINLNVGYQLGFSP